MPCAILEPLPSNPPADIPFSVAALLLVGATVDIATFREEITWAH